MCEHDSVPRVQAVLVVRWAWCHVTGKGRSSSSNSSSGGSNAQWNITLAEAGDTRALVALINAAFAEAEGNIWVEGASFKRTSPEKIAGVISAKQLYVALPVEPSTGMAGGLLSPEQNCAVETAKLTVPGSNADAGTNPRQLAGCVCCARATSTVAGVPTAVVEFGLLCVAPAYQHRGLATCLVSHSEDVARALHSSTGSNGANHAGHAGSTTSAGSAVVQCELLVPRDMAAHPHAFKEMMLRSFYTRLGYTVDRRVPFEHACVSKPLICFSKLLCLATKNQNKRGLVACERNLPLGLR